MKASETLNHFPFQHLNVFIYLDVFHVKGVLTSVNIMITWLMNVLLSHSAPLFLVAHMQIHTMTCLDGSTNCLCHQHKPQPHNGGIFIHIFKDVSWIWAIQWNFQQTKNDPGANRLFLSQIPGSVWIVQIRSGGNTVSGLGFSYRE